MKTKFYAVLCEQPSLFHCAINFNDPKYGRTFSPFENSDAFFVETMAVVATTPLEKALFSLVFLNIV